MKSAYEQWSVKDDKIYRPAGRTTGTLPSGMYKVLITIEGILLERKELQTDDLIVMDGSAAVQVVANVRKFWDSKGVFRALGLLHKRGALLYGPPGCGKTATVEILAKDVIRNDGIVLVAGSTEHAIAGLKLVRDVEPDCKVVLVMEDLDTWFQSKRGDSQLSNLLDGENQVENVVYLATTNFINKIPGRFKNRPSRFDEVVEIHMPSAAVRERYLESKIPADFRSAGMIGQWVSETDGFSIAHLRELVVGVLALGRPFDEVIARLRAMQGAKEPVSDNQPQLLVANQAKMEVSN